ncbi:MAG: hypothetical protein AAFY15_07220 [Cyanobacteria bacterium J06648_11]
MAIARSGKIIALWSVFLFGTVFHTQLALMPLFHGIDVATAHSHATESIADISLILWLMLLFFVLPMGAIAATAFWESRRYRIVHFQLTIVYTIMNFLHFVLDFTVIPIQWYQITLMFALFVNGILLNMVAWQWLKESSNASQTKSDRAKNSTALTR